MPKKIQFYTVFLESEEFGREDFSAEGWQDAMKLIKEIHRDAMREIKEDGIERKIGIIVSGEVDQEER